MNFLIALGLVLLAMLCWSMVILAIYFALYSRHDSSGDQGLGFGFLAILPWIAPYFAFQKLKAIWRRYRQPRKSTLEHFTKVLPQAPINIDRLAHCDYCGEAFIRDTPGTPGNLTYNYCSSACAEHD